MLLVLILSMISIPSYSNDKLIQEVFGADEHDDHEEEPSACELNTLDDLLHQFENQNVYIQMHTDDGDDHPNTGPGDIAKGEIRGNIGPDGDGFSAVINKDNQIIEDTDYWHDVTATATIEFPDDGHSNHIDFTLTVNNLHNVVGIHLHQGDSTENSPIHLVDLLRDNFSLIDGVDNGPIHHMNTVFTGEITVDDLCPVAHDHGGDEEPQPEDDMTFDASTGTITGIWDDGDATSLSHMINNLLSEELYIQVHTAGYPDGAIRGQIILNDDTVRTFFAGSGGGSSGGSTGGGSGGGGSISSFLAPNVILYNACSNDLDGIMRVVTFNQPDRDLDVKLAFKDFSTWAINVSDEVSHLKYLDIPDQKYEYSVFDARFPTDLESIWVVLYDTKNSKRFISHLVTFPSNSCLGSEVPFPLREPDAHYLKPFEPLEIPQPEVIEPTIFEIQVNYEGKMAQKTFNLITEHKPVFQKFEDPNNLPYTPMPWNDSWSELKQCYEVGERNRHHCSFGGKLFSQNELAEIKFAEITWSEPVRQNFDEKIHYNKIYRGAIWLGES